MLIKIKKKIKDLKKKNINRFLRNIHELDFNDFIEKLKNEKNVLDYIENIFNGDIIILRKTLSKDFINNSIKKLQQYCLDNPPISPKILEGSKNGYYISNNTSTGYRTIDRSFYFFSWNEDTLDIYNTIHKTYKKLKILNGLDEDEITTNTPKDYVVERLHVINYPPVGGEISKHTDPVNVSIINHGIFGSEFGIDYDRGGFYLIDSEKKKIDIDKKLNKGDSILFFPGLIHGVDPIYLGNTKVDFKKSSGRWYFNFQNIETHEVKNRQTTQAVD